MRTQTLMICFLLTCLLLATSQQHYFKVQASDQSVQFKTRPAQPSSRSRNGKVYHTRVEGKKFRRSPSGPNPAGNHRPPSTR